MSTRIRPIITLHYEFFWFRLRLPGRSMMGQITQLMTNFGYQDRTPYVDLVGYVFEVRRHWIDVLIVITLSITRNCFLPRIEIPGRIMFLGSSGECHVGY